MKYQKDHFRNRFRTNQIDAGCRQLFLLEGMQYLGRVKNKANTPYSILKYSWQSFNPTKWPERAIQQSDVQSPKVGFSVSIGNSSS
jgi:hypothetical protein